jgi:gluconokinase
MRSEPPPILVIMGVSGSGKSTIAAALVERLGWPFEEGDALHPAANVAKMAAGVPLADADRAPWLAAVAAWINARQVAGEPGIITCSALRRRYRDALRGSGVVFVYLRGPKELIKERVVERKGHFMPASLVDSQVEALEPPEPDEHSITVDARAGVAAEVEEIIDRLGLSDQAIS